MRDAFLAEHSTLLDELMEAGDDSVVSLLTHELPLDLALPEKTQSIVIQCAEAAINTPSEQTIRVLHDMLTTLSLTTILSKSTIGRLEDQLLEIVGKTSSAKGDRRTLYALSAMSSIISATRDSPDTSMHGAAESLKMEQFFTGRKASKTMQLLALKALWSSRERDEESMRLINRLIALIPVSIKSAWHKENEQVSARLESTANFDPALMLFVSAIKGEYGTSGSAEHRMRQDRADFLQSLQLVSSTKLDLFTKSENVWDVSGHLAKLEGDEIVSCVDPLVQYINTAAASTTHEWSVEKEDCLESFLKHIARLRGSSGNTSEAVCSCAVDHAGRRIVHAYCALFLRKADRSNAALVSLVLAAYGESAASSQTCVRHLTTKEPQSLSWMDNGSENLPQCQDWRTGLRAILEQRSAQEHDLLTKLFTNACHSLEERCQNVEEPLRAEQRRMTQLQERFDELTKTCQDVELARAELDKLMKIRDHELIHCRSEVQVCRDQNAVLSKKVAIAEEDMRRLCEQSRQDLDTRHNEQEMARLEIAASYARHEEELEESQARLVVRERELETLHACVEEQQKSITKHESEASDLQEIIAGLKTQLQNDEGLHVEHMERFRRDAQAKDMLVMKRLDEKEQELLRAEQRLQDLEVQHDREKTELISRLDQTAYQVNEKNEELLQAAAQVCTDTSPRSSD